MLQEKAKNADAENNGSEKEAKNTDRLGLTQDMCSTVKNSARDPTFDNQGTGHE